MKIIMHRILSLSGIILKLNIVGMTLVLCTEHHNGYVEHTQYAATGQIIHGITVVWPHTKHAY